MIDDRLQQPLVEACAPYSDFLSSWEEIQDYYVDTHGVHRWIGRLVTTLTGHTPSSGRPYYSARRRIERWASGTTRPGKNSKKDLAELGKKLPPKRWGVPPGGLDFDIVGTFYVSKKEGSRERTIHVHLDEMEAIDMLVNDLPKAYERIFEAYSVDGDMFAHGMQSDVTVSVS